VQWQTLPVCKQGWGMPDPPARRVRPFGSGEPPVWCGKGASDGLTRPSLLSLEKPVLPRSLIGDMGGDEALRLCFFLFVCRFPP
jgi:hypothetical protein